MFKTKKISSQEFYSISKNLEHCLVQYLHAFQVTISVQRKDFEANVSSKVAYTIESKILFLTAEGIVKVAKVKLR